MIKGDVVRESAVVVAAALIVTITMVLPWSESSVAGERVSVVTPVVGATPTVMPARAAGR